MLDRVRRETWASRVSVRVTTGNIRWAMNGPTPSESSAAPEVGSQWKVLPNTRISTRPQ